MGVVAPLRNALFLRQPLTTDRLVVAAISAERAGTSVR